MKILIVDDEHDARRFLRKIAERAYHQVIEAENGQEGLRLAAEQRPDLIISDALMPVMDGFYFLREIKQDKELRDTPFIFYSATYTGDEDIRLAISMGAAGYIIKPKEAEELWAEIGLALEKSKKEKRAVSGLATSEEEKEYLRRHTHILALKLEQTVIKLRETLAANEQARLEIQKLNRDLVVRNEEMESFLYITTHDLRSPLLNIQGFSQNIESYCIELRESLAAAPLPPKTKDKLEKLAGDRIPGALGFMLAAARSMDSLMTALLKVSRIGRAEMKPEVLEITALFKEIVEAMRYQLDEAGSKVNFSDLPRCKADRGAVTKLFANLLDNAVKYRRKDRALVVNVTGKVKGPMAVYTVADNGSGIAAADIHKIWDLFYRPQMATETGGEGIGLSIVKRLIIKNGGTVRAESQEGEGTTFHVELPVAP